MIASLLFCFIFSTKLKIGCEVWWISVFDWEYQQVEEFGLTSSPLSCFKQPVRN